MTSSNVTPVLRSRVTPIAVLACAALIGALSAFGTHLFTVATAHGAPAYAGAHCTRYVPSTTTDAYCGQTANTSPYNINGCSSGSALRDDNTVSISSSQDWELHYGDVTCSNNVGAVTGHGTYGYQAGNGGHYYIAECMVWYSTFGDCTTDWHN